MHRIGEGSCSRHRGRRCDSGITFTIIGTDDNGNPIKDSVTGSNGATVASHLNFKTVTSITASGATASTITVGTNGVGSTPWVILDDHVNTPNLRLGAIATGTINYSVEYTDQPFLTPIPSPTAPTSSIANGPNTPNPAVWSYTAMANQTASSEGQISETIHAWRLTVNSGNGSVTVTGRQAGLASP